MDSAFAAFLEVVAATASQAESSSSDSDSDSQQQQAAAIRKSWSCTRIHEDLDLFFVRKPPSAHEGLFIRADKVLLEKRKQKRKTPLKTK